MLEQESENFEELNDRDFKDLFLEKQRSKSEKKLSQDQELQHSKLMGEFLERHPDKR